MKLRILLYIIFFCTSLSRASVGGVTFDNFGGITDRLCVRKIIQAPDSMLWLAAESGLYSFDGYNLRHHDICASIPGRRFGSFNCMVIDGDRLIIGCNDGLILFNLDDYIFSTADYADHEIINDIEESGGSLWVATEQGLYRDGVRMAIDIRDIFSLESDGEFLYIGTLGSLKKYSLADNCFYDVAGRWDYVLSLLDDGADLLVGTGEAVSRVRKSDGALLNRRMVPVAKNILKVPDGGIMVGTDDGLFVLIGDNVRRFQHDARNVESLPGNVVWSMLRDREGNLWVGTDTGLAVVHDGGVRNYSLSDVTGSGTGNMITCLRADSKGRIWLGGNTGLLCISGLDSPAMNYRWYRMNDRDYPLPHNRVRCIEEFADGTLLIGGDMGMLRYDETTGQFVNQADSDMRERARWVYNIKGREDGKIDVVGFTESYVVGMNEELDSFHIIGVSGHVVSGVLETARDSVLKAYGLGDLYMSAFVDTLGSRILLGGKDRFGIIDDAGSGPFIVRPFRITGIRVNDSYDISPAELNFHELSFDEGTKFLEIMMSDFGYGRSDRSDLRYRVDGGDWIPLKSVRGSFMLTDIESGSHRLEIADERAATVVGFMFHVAVPWYRSWYAKVIYAILIISVLVLIWYSLRQRFHLAAEKLKTSEMIRLTSEKEAKLVSEKELLSAQLRWKMQGQYNEEHLSDDERFLARITAVIESNISDSDLNVNKLSELTGVSGKQLYRKVKSLTGLTVVAYIRDMRLKKAASLLERGDLTVSETMYAVGFTNPSYFTRCFQNEYGTNPSGFAGRNVT